MNDWKSLLKADATEWLLEETHPSIRYLALQWLLDRPESDSDVVAAQEAIAQSTSVKKILQRQRPEGYWGSDPRPHHGTRGYLLLLKWLGYRGNGAVHKAMDYRINGCLLPDGAYGIELKGRIVKLPCHGADLLRLMLWYGYKHDPRARKLLRWLISVQEQEGVWPCVSKLRPFSCLWATAVVLRAYRDLPAEWITPEVAASWRRAVDLFLDANIYQYGKGKPSPRWFEFGFPLQFDTDILEVLELIAPYVEPEEERIGEALRLVLEKQDAQGRWPCEKQAKGGRWMQKLVDIEATDQPSKWVTLHAMKMLRTLYQDKVQVGGG